MMGELKKGYNISILVGLCTSVLHREGEANC